jgi:hypothetical protein
MLRWYCLLLILCLIVEDRVFSDREDGSSQIEIDALPIIPVTSTEMPYRPTDFLRMSLERYQQEVKGYSAILLKHERVLGKLEKPEKIEIFFREQPFSVYMNWLEGGVGFPAPQKVLYVKGENDDKLLAKGRGLLSIGVWPKDIHSEEVEKTGRFTIDTFGIYLGTERTVDAMLKAEKKGMLHVQYKGVVQVPQLENRECYKFVRTPYDEKEDEGINEYTYYIDKENGLQVGSVLKDAEGKLIGSYFFSHLKINPEFKKDQFTKAGM